MSGNGVSRTQPTNQMIIDEILGVIKDCDVVGVGVSDDVGVPAGLLGGAGSSTEFMRQRWATNVASAALCVDQLIGQEQLVTDVALVPLVHLRLV